MRGNHYSLIHNKPISFSHKMQSKKYTDAGKRLRVARDILKLSRKEIADALGVKHHRITEMECGRVRLQVDTAIKLEEMYGVDLRWLLTGEGEMGKKQDAGGEEIVFIQAVSRKLQHDGSFLLLNDRKKLYQFSQQILSTIELYGKAYLTTFTGNSMEPTIYNRDVVMIDTGRTHVYDGELYALRLDDTLMIKRLSLRPQDMIKVISDNREHDSYETARSNVTVLAQVVWFARTLVGM